MLLATSSKAAKAAAKHAAIGQRHSLIPHWLTQLGGLGLFAVAVLDSSPIPLPIPGSTDLLLLLLVSHHGNPFLLACRQHCLRDLALPSSAWAGNRRKRICLS